MRRHYEGAGDDRKYVWPELNYDDFGNSKDPVLLMLIMRMDENNTTVYDDHVAIWLRSPIVECSETDGGFNSAVGIGKFFDFCRDGKASNVEGQKEYEINYSFMPEGCKIQQMTAAARALSPWLNDKIPVGAGWTEANTSTLDW